MKNSAIFLLSCWALVMLASHLAEARPRTVRVAMVPLSGSSRTARKIAWKTTLTMTKTLKHSKTVKAVMINRHRTRRMRQCLQVPHCVKLLSRKLRVRYLVAGHVSRLGRRYHIDLRVISSSSGDVVSSGSFRVRQPRAAQSSGARLASRLIRDARKGVRVASASKSISDASTPTDNGLMFSKSEAESAANIIEARDREDPLKPEEPKVVENATMAHLESAVEPTPTVVAEQTFQTSLFSKRYWHAWTTGSLGLAALGGGVALGYISRQANQAAHDAEYQKEAWINRDKSKKNALLANILYGAGGAAVLTSAVMFYLEHRKEAREKRMQRDLSIQFNVAQGGGGLLIKGAF